MSTLINVRNDYTKKPPPPNLATLRAVVASVAERKAIADRKLKYSVDRNDGTVDLNELSRNVHKLATELAEAEGALAAAEAREKAEAAGRRRTRLATIGREIAEAKEQFADLYKQASLMLGRFYALGEEARTLANGVLNPLGNGDYYVGPEIKEILAAADADPNPLPALQGAGYREIQTFASWKRHVPLIPLKEK